MLRYGLAKEDGRYKYPNMLSAIAGNRNEICSIIQSHNTPPAEDAAAERIGDLSRLLDVQREYDLGLDEWILERALEIRVVNPDAEGDMPEAAELVGAIYKFNRLPADSGKQSNFASLFQLAAVSLPTTGSDAPWADLNVVYCWLEATLDQRYSANCYDSMYRGFLRWLNVELESIVENADSRESAEQMADELQHMATEIFGRGLFGNDFVAFEARVDDRFGEVDDYEYYDEDDYSGTPLRTRATEYVAKLNEPKPLREESPEQIVHGLFGNLA
jgi:hypothetical protein